MILTDLRLVGDVMVQISLLPFLITVTEPELRSGIMTTIGHETRVHEADLLGRRIHLEMRY